MNYTGNTATTLAGATLSLHWQHCHYTDNTVTTLATMSLHWQHCHYTGADPPTSYCGRDETYAVVLTGDFTLVLARAVSSDFVEEGDKTVMLHAEGGNSDRGSWLVLVFVSPALVPDNFRCCHHHLQVVCRQQHAMCTHVKTYKMSHNECLWKQVSFSRIQTLVTCVHTNTSTYCYMQRCTHIHAHTLSLSLSLSLSHTHTHTQMHHTHTHTQTFHPQFHTLL